MSDAILEMTPPPDDDEHWGVWRGDPAPAAAETARVSVAEKQTVRQELPDEPQHHDAHDAIGVAEVQIQPEAAAFPPIPPAAQSAASAPPVTDAPAAEALVQALAAAVGPPVLPPGGEQAPAQHIAEEVIAFADQLAAADTPAAAAPDPVVYPVERPSLRVRKDVTFALRQAVRGEWMTAEEADRLLWRHGGSARRGRRDRRRSPL